MISPSKLIFENDVASVIQIRLEKMQMEKIDLMQRRFELIFD